MRSNSLKLGFWQLFAILLALIPLWNWSTGSVPRTDRTFEKDVVFLENARHAVLPGNSYTVRAANRARERRLFDLTLGMTPDRDAIVTRYDHEGRPIPNAARYVVADNGYTGGEKLRFVVRFEGGVVYQRGTP